MSLIQVGRCINCRARETEPAREGCKNPIWHIPPEPEPVPEPEPETEEDGPF